MYVDERNEYGCPLRDQSGADAVRNFADIIDSWSAELRAAFEEARAAHRQELEALVRSA
jgi:hypothetical protein